MNDSLLDAILPPWQHGNGGFELQGDNRTVPEQVESGYLTLLPESGVLGIAGPDAATFLQGQLSCDVSTLDASRAVRGVHATPKGRAVASFQLLQVAPEDYAFLLPTSALPSLQQALGKYIVFSRAELTDHSGEFSLLALGGPGAEACIVDYFSTAPAAVGEQVSRDEGHCLRLEGPQPRFSVLLQNRAVTVFWERASQQLKPAASAAHLLEDIRQGVASIEGSTSEAFIPQMLNYDRLGAISFSKGCYTGQEVIARAHYKGAVKRRMRGFSADTATIPAAGEEVSSDGKACGQVVNAVRLDSTRSEGLVVLAEDFAASATLADGTALATYPLSYPDGN